MSYLKVRMRKMLQAYEAFLPVMGAMKGVKYEDSRTEGNIRRTLEVVSCLGYTSKFRFGGRDGKECYEHMCQSFWNKRIFTFMTELLGVVFHLYLEGE